MCCGRLPVEAGELDVLLGAGEEVGVGDVAEVLADTGGVALAGGDDGLEVGDLLVLAADGLGGLVQLVVQDVGEDGVVAAAIHVGEGLGGLFVLTGEDLDDAQVLLGVGSGGAAEAVRGGGEVVLAEGDDSLGVEDVGIVGVHLAESGLGLGELAFGEVEGGEVELGALGIELADGAVVDRFLLVVALHEGGGAEEGFLVQHVSVVVEELEEFLGGVVLVLDVGDEAGAAEFREDLTLEGGEHLGHVADLVLTDGRVAVHGEDAEDELLVFDVGLLHEMLEAFPVLTEALDLGAGDVLVLLAHFLEGLVRGSGALVGELVVLVLGAFRGGVGKDLGALDGGALVGIDLVDGGEEVLHGLALELGVADVGAVHQVLDLALGGAGDDLLVGIGLRGHEAVALDEHVGGVHAVGNLLGGQVDELVTLAGDPAELEVALLHAGNIVEVDALGDGLAVGGDDLVVVLDFFTLVDEGSHLGLATLVNEDGGHLEDRLGVEVVGRVVDGHGGVDAIVHRLEHAGVAGDLHVFSHLGHLFDRGAGDGRGENCSGSQEFERFLHHYQ